MIFLQFPYVSASSLLVCIALSASLPTSSNLQRQIFVCTNKTCKKDGSIETFEMAKDLCPTSIQVSESGCHCQCGSGPNLVTSPSGKVYEGVIEPSTLAHILEIEYNLTLPELAIVSYKEKMCGDQDLKRGRFREALEKYESVINATSFEFFPSALSSAYLSKAECCHRLALSYNKNRFEMLSDAADSARKSIQLQSSRREAWLRLCDVLDACGETQEALNILDEMALIFPEKIMYSSGIQKKRTRLEEKLKSSA